MKAAVYSRYGPTDVVQVKDVEILIEVRAASVPANKPDEQRKPKGKKSDSPDGQKGFLRSGRK
jgi:hypothetical protein